MRDAPSPTAVIPELAWSSETAALGDPVRWRFQLPVPAAPPRVWEVLSDTSRLNRALGLGPIAYVEEGGVLRGSATTRGVAYRWVELPWAWVAGRWMSCFRIYENGLATHAAVGYAIEPIGGRESLVHVAIDWYPRGAFARIALGLLERRILRLYQRAFARLAKAVAVAEPLDRAFARGARPLLPEALHRVSAIRERLVTGGVDPALADLLIAHVAEGDELDLARIRVRPLARSAGVDERALCVACLHATRAGLLQLSWEAICPHCRGPKHAARTLADVPPRAACASCQVEFPTDGPHAVEITFGVHPSIRAVERPTYCFAEASSKAHVKLQQAVPPGARRTLAVALAPGRYRARIVGEAGHRHLDVTDRSAVTEVTLGDGEGPLEAAPRADVTLINEGVRRRVFVIEDVQWADDALRPAQLFNLQEFRDFFAAEHLAPDVELHVGEQAILFSDIVGSTRFYERHGDSRAFAVVKRHFAAIYEEVRAQRGVVVKTIGDAAMAAFVDPADALRAAARIQRRFSGHEGGAESPDAPPSDGLRVRISVNVGPCIAVNLNSGVDYFGRTVNLAAKIQPYASAGQIVFPASLLRDARVAALIAEEQPILDQGVTTLPSTGESLEVCCWDGSSPASQAAPQSAGFF